MESAPFAFSVAFSDDARIEASSRFTNKQHLLCYIPSQELFVLFHKRSIVEAGPQESWFSVKRLKVIAINQFILQKCIRSAEIEAYCVVPDKARSLVFSRFFREPAVITTKMINRSMYKVIEIGLNNEICPDNSKVASVKAAVGKT